MSLGTTIMRPKIERRKFLKLAIATLFGLFSGCSVFRTQGRRRTRTKFVFCTDLHSRPEWQVPIALESVASRINSEKPEFIVCGGDLISQGLSLSQEEASQRWDIFKNFRLKLFGEFYSVPGNHDLQIPEDAVQERFQYAARENYLSATNKKLSFQIVENGDLVLVLLDSLEVLEDRTNDSYRGFISKEQIQWLEEALLGYSPEHNFVIVSHVPFRSEYFRRTNANHEVPPSQYVENYEEVLRLFKRKNLLAVLQGHTHVNETIVEDGVPFITAGAVSGNWWCGQKEGSGEGFLVVEVLDGILRYHFVEYNWETPRSC